jgi:hypothetical protein
MANKKSPPRKASSGPKAQGFSIQKLNPFRQAGDAMKGANQKHAKAQASKGRTKATQGRAAYTSPKTKPRLPDKGAKPLKYSGTVYSPSTAKKVTQATKKRQYKK